MYFVLECQPTGDEDFYRLEVVDDAGDNRWEAGVMFTRDEEREGLRPPATPIELATEEEEDPELASMYPELLWNPIPLMSRRLVEALRAAGVDNLQVFETTLEVIGAAVPKDHYLAVNIAGLVEAANMAESELNPETADRMTSTDFLSLAVNPDKARGLLMFRLAENVTAVLVHEHVKEHVERAGITTLTWVEPEGWAG